MEPNHPSRFTRKKENKADRFLNWAIGIVAVLILIVGGFLLLSIQHSPSHHSETPYAQAHNNNQKKGNSSSTSTNVGGSSSKDTSQTNDQSNNQNSTTSDQSSSSQATTNTATTGSWQPIGTTQQEPHHKSYQKGSVDWNEMVKALSYATGIKEDNMTVWWLGNGGGPDLSVGRVSKKGESQKKYEVHLKWVTNKGWMPTSVKEIDGSQ